MLQDYVPLWQKKCMDGGCSLVPCHFQPSALTKYPVVRVCMYVSTCVMTGNFAGENFTVLLPCANVSSLVKCIFHQFVRSKIHQPLSHLACSLLLYYT